jgi:heat shock protein HtpX
MLSTIRRIGLFLILNIVIVLSVSLLLKVLNVQPYLSHYGLNITQLAIFCLVWGMSGAFISLLLSRKTAKWILGVRLIEAHERDHDLNFVRRIVERQAMSLGLPMPEVGIFETSVVNAFATGPSRSRSLVAVSRGLLNNLSHEEIEAVIGHEMSHIANGDMVTMTLLQGVVNAFVMFLARVLAFALSAAGNRKEDSRSSSNGSFYLFTFIFEIIFMLLGSMIIAAYSRYREYRADAGGAALSSTTKMIKALSSLGRVHDSGLPKQAGQSLEAFMIRGNPSRLMQLFSTHPPIEKRIERLKSSYPM